MSNLNKIVRIKTEHSQEIKVLFDVLKDFLTEVNISFLANPEQNISSQQDENSNKKKKSSDSESESESDSGSDSDSDSDQKNQTKK